MRLTAMTAVGIAIGTSVMPTLIMVTSLFLLVAPGGASTHGTTIPIMGTAITRITTPTITRIIPMTGITTSVLRHIVTTMAMRLLTSIAARLSLQYSRSSPALGIITAQSTAFS